eukprot:359563-Chlamydomonas_euryale.AAC.1
MDVAGASLVSSLSMVRSGAGDQGGRGGSGGGAGGGTSPSPCLRRGDADAMREDLNGCLASLCNSGLEDATIQVWTV